jgi:hypothetical protein
LLEIPNSRDDGLREKESYYFLWVGQVFLKSLENKKPLSEKI